MHAQQFQALLAQGLGRPLLYLQSHDARPYREVILYACTHDLRYDHQCEDSRAPYLFDLIQRTGEADFYRQRILSSLQNPAEDEDIYQMVGLAYLFAQQGDTAARSMMYSVLHDVPPSRTLRAQRN
ncbi:MAG TPA: hypothetical protein VFB38_03865 [Chthonomonadaceae bacterium]|nr:hypothetical protein [Chthonomonadaceae bacterium]